jgi:hypothetical protein
MKQDLGICGDSALQNQSRTAERILGITSGDPLRGNLATPKQIYETGFGDLW